MDIVDSIKSALERFAGIEIFHSLDVSMWNGLPLFSKVCFAAAAVLLVLYIGLVIRGRLFGGHASDLLPNLPSFIRRVCSGYALVWGVLRTQSV